MSVSELIAMLMNNSKSATPKPGMASPGAGSAPMPLNDAAATGVPANVVKTPSQPQFLVSDLMDQSQPKKSGL